MNYNAISSSRWFHLKNNSDMYEVYGSRRGKKVTYLEVKVWMRDKNDNIRYNHVLINENWY